MALIALLLAQFTAIFIAICANLVIYVPLFLVGRTLCRPLASRHDIFAKPRMTRWAMPLAFAVITASVPVLYFDVSTFRQIQALARDDKTFAGKAGEADSLALLLNPALKPKGNFAGPPNRRHFGAFWPDQDNCSVSFCQNLLIDGIVRHVLIGWEHQFRPELDPAEKLTRFSLSSKEDCQQLAATLRGRDRRESGVDRKRSGGAGATAAAIADDGFFPCIERENAVLSQADMVVLGIPIPNTKDSQWLPGSHAYYGVVGGRLSLYRREAGSLQEMHRETHLGGSYLFAPPIVMPGTVGIIFAEPLHFARIDWREPAPFDIDSRLFSWGLSRRVDGELIRP